MPYQPAFRPHHLALAIALALGCTGFSHAQDEVTLAAPSAPMKGAKQPVGKLGDDPIAALQALSAAGSTVSTVIDSAQYVLKAGAGDDLITIKNGGSFNGRADGRGGNNMIHLDAAEGGELGDTRHFNRLYSSEGAWTLTSKGDFKEGVIVLKDAAVTNSGKILGDATTFGQLFNTGEIKGHVKVEPDGTFAGAGTVGSLDVHGLLNVNPLQGAPKVKGNLTFSESAVLAYGVNPDGTAETIKVNGTASLGGATLKIVTAPGDFAQSSQHTLIEAKAIDGEFGRIVHDLAFLQPEPQYNKKNVGLIYTRNDALLADLATSENAGTFAANLTDPQVLPQAPIPTATPETPGTEPEPVAFDDVPATPLAPVARTDIPARASKPDTTPDIPSKAAEPVATAGMPSTSAKVTAAHVAQKTPAAPNAAITALLASNRQTASMALEQLAGSSNANLAKVTLSSAEPVNGSLLSAMRQLDSTHRPGQLRNAPRQASSGEDQGRVWIQALGHGGKLDREVVPLQHSTKGLLIGTDWAVDEAWHLGVMAGKSRTRLDSRELEGGLDSWHLGAYALRQSGPMSIRMGATYSNHDGNTARRVAFTGFSDRPEGRYDASTQSGFAELGYNLGRDNFSIEPFASLGFQRYQRDGYTEKGGAAALKVHDRTQSNMNSTMGLRLAKVDTLNNGMRLTPRFSAAWKKTYGNTYTETRQRLVTGGRDYTAYGVELDRNSLLVDAGVDLGLSTHHTVGVALTSELGTDSRNHGVMGQWRLAF